MAYVGLHTFQCSVMEFEKKIMIISLAKYTVMLLTMELPLDLHVCQKRNDKRNPM